MSARARNVHCDAVEQERFDDAVDNSGASWVPRPAVGPWAGRPMPALAQQPPVVDAEGNITRRGGYPHPLQQALDSLAYPAWQLAPVPPHLPQVRSGNGWPWNWNVNSRRLWTRCCTWRGSWRRSRRRWNPSIDLGNGTLIAEGSTLAALPGVAGVAAGRCSRHRCSLDFWTL